MRKQNQTSANQALIDSAATAADRFFRTYFRHSTTPDEDTLFDLLNALHSLNDRLSKSFDATLHGSANFTVLRKLRNLFHHEAELLHEVRLIHAREIPIVISDLAQVCLVSRDLIVQSLKGEKRPDIGETVMSTVRWYRTVADIQPCIFNAAVDVYEMIQPLELGLVSEAYEAFHEAYEDETLHNRGHRVAGEISCRVGEIDLVLERLFRQPVARNRQ